MQYFHLSNGKVSDSSYIGIMYQLNNGNLDKALNIMESTPKRSELLFLLLLLLLVGLAVAILAMIQSELS